jgi:hypothetical protein
MVNDNGNGNANEARDEINQAAVHETDFEEHAVNTEDLTDANFVAFNASECIGYGLLDGGASRSVGGVDQLEAIQDALLETGKDVTVDSQAQLGFSFAGGDRADAPARVALQVDSLDKNPVSIYVLDRPSPILLGIDMLKRYGLVIDYQNDTVYSRVLGRELETKVLASGHLVLNLMPGLSEPGSSSSPSLR